MRQNTKRVLYFMGFIFAASLTACSGGGAPTQSAGVSPEILNKKSAPHAPYGSANNPGVLEPVLTTLSGNDVRIPNTDQVDDDGVQVNVVGDVVSSEASGPLVFWGIRSHM